jgi:hypothetical protein
LRNNFHHAYAEIGVRSNFAPEEPKLKQDVRLNYDFLMHQIDYEHRIGVASVFTYDVLFKKLNGFLRPQLDFNFENYIHTWGKDFICTKPCPDFVKRFQGTKYSFKVEFIPSVKFAVKEYHVRLGMGIPIINSLNSNVKGEVKGKLRCPVYPVAEVQLGILPGILSIYAGVDGEAKYNSLKDLLFENPFVKVGLDSLRFTKTQISVYGGVKGNIVRKLNYHISARYSRANDMAFFFLDTLSLLKNQFDVVYSNVDFVNVCANLNWQVVNKLYLNLEANYWGYFNLNSIEKPWYKPYWEVALAGKYYLKEKFIFDANMKLEFSSYALVPKLDADENMTYNIEKMSPILNFGVGFEYLITKRFSCFATINNVGAQYFSKYYDFKNIGFNAIVGITYSFGEESLRKAKNVR